MKKKWTFRLSFDTFPPQIVKFCIKNVNLTSSSHNFLQKVHVTNSLNHPPTVFSQTRKFIYETFRLFDYLFVQRKKRQRRNFFLCHLSENMSTLNKNCKFTGTSETRKSSGKGCNAVREMIKEHHTSYFRFCYRIKSQEERRNIAFNQIIVFLFSLFAFILIRKFMGSTWRFSTKTVVCGFGIR